MKKFAYWWKNLRSTNIGTPKICNCFKLPSDWLLSYCESQWEKKYFRMCLRNIWMLHSHFTRPYKTWPISWFKSQDLRSSCKVYSQQTYNVRRQKLLKKAKKSRKITKRVILHKGGQFSWFKSKDFKAELHNQITTNLRHKKLLEKVKFKTWILLLHTSAISKSYSTYKKVSVGLWIFLKYQHTQRKL